MTSIMTNTAAMAALQTLRSINSDMETTQNRISSGLRVETASDNAAYWSISTTMKSDSSAMSTVKDALGLGAAKVDVAYTGMNSAIEVVQEIKDKLVLASEPSTDKAKIQEELSALQQQLITIGKSGSFNGENLLVGAQGETTTIVSSFDRTGAAVSISSISVDLDETRLFNVDGTGVPDATGLLGTVGTNYTTGSILTMALHDGTDPAAGADIADMLSDVELVLSAMTDAASGLGSVSKRIELQESFVANLMDAVDRGVGRLVDADMNEESTRLKALQTQQQLGIQALSIANSESQNILSLFR